MVGRRQRSTAQGDLHVGKFTSLGAFRQMGTYFLTVCFHMDSPLPAPRHLPLRIRRRLRPRLHQGRIAEGCAVEWIGGSRRARCAGEGQCTVQPRICAGEFRPSCKDADLRGSRDRWRAHNGLCAVGLACCYRGVVRNLLYRLASIRKTRAHVEGFSYSRPCAVTSASC